MKQINQKLAFHSTLRGRVMAKTLTFAAPPNNYNTKQHARAVPAIPTPPFPRRWAGFRKIPWPLTFKRLPRSERLANEEEKLFFRVTELGISPQKWVVRPMESSGGAVQRTYKSEHLKRSQNCYWGQFVIYLIEHAALIMSLPLTFNLLWGVHAYLHTNKAQYVMLVRNIEKGKTRGTLPRWFHNQETPFRDVWRLKRLLAKGPVLCHQPRGTSCRA